MSTATPRSSPRRSRRSSRDRRGARGCARVRLRDVTLDDADLLDAWNADPASAGEFNDFGGSPKPIDREALARGPLRNERNGQLIVERVADGKPIGTVGWHAVGYGPNPESSGLEHRDRAAARGPRPGLRTRGPGTPRGVPVREHRRQPDRGPDRRRQHRRATVAREGRLRARRDGPRRPVPGRRLPRPRDATRSSAAKRRGETRPRQAS